MNGRRPEPRLPDPGRDPEPSHRADFWVWLVGSALIAGFVLAIMWQGADPRG